MKEENFYIFLKKVSQCHRTKEEVSHTRREQPKKLVTELTFLRLHFLFVTK